MKNIKQPKVVLSHELNPKQNLTVAQARAIQSKFPSSTKSKPIDVRKIGKK